MQEILLSVGAVVRDMRKFISKAENSNETFQFHHKHNSCHILHYPFLWFRAKGMAMFMVVTSNEDKREAQDRSGGNAMEIKGVLYKRVGILDAEQGRVNSRQICNISCFVAIESN